MVLWGKWEVQWEDSFGLQAWPGHLGPMHHSEGPRKTTRCMPYAATTRLKIRVHRVRQAQVLTAIPTIYQVNPVHHPRHKMILKIFSKYGELAIAN